jgi:hypothetical protein
MNISSCTVFALTTAEHLQRRPVILGHPRVAILDEQTNGSGSAVELTHLQPLHHLPVTTLTQQTTPDKPWPIGMCSALDTFFQLDISNEIISPQICLLLPAIYNVGNYTSLLHTFTWVSAARYSSERTNTSHIIGCLFASEQGCVYQG